MPVHDKVMPIFKNEIGKLEDMRQAFRAQQKTSGTTVLLSEENKTILDEACEHIAKAINALYKIN